MINLLLVNNFYPVIPYRRVRQESDELLYTVWSLVMVRNQLPAQVVKCTKVSRLFSRSPSPDSCRCRKEKMVGPRYPKIPSISSRHFCLAHYSLDIWRSICRVVWISFLLKSRAARYWKPAWKFIIVGNFFIEGRPVYKRSCVVSTAARDSRDFPSPIHFFVIISNADVETKWKAVFTTELLKRRDNVALALLTALTTSTFYNAWNTKRVRLLSSIFSLFVVVSSNKQTVCYGVYLKGLPCLFKITVKDGRVCSCSYKVVWNFVTWVLFWFVIFFSIFSCKANVCYCNCGVKNSYLKFEFEFLSDRHHNLYQSDRNVKDFLTVIIVDSIEMHRTWQIEYYFQENYIA